MSNTTYNNENFSIDATNRHLLEYICKEIVPDYSLVHDEGDRGYEFRDMAEKCDKEVAEHALMVLRDLSDTSKYHHGVTARKLTNTSHQMSQEINKLERELQELKDTVKMFDLIGSALSIHYREFRVACNDEEDGDEW